MKQFKKLNPAGLGRTKILALVAAVVVVAGIASYAVPQKTQADVSPVSLCGSGYQVVRQTQIPGRPAMAYILKNYGSQTACGVVISTGSAYGTYKQLYAHIYVEDWNHNIVRNSPSDYGQYKYYAGPVYVSYAGLPIGYPYDDIALDARAYGTQVILPTY